MAIAYELYTQINGIIMAGEQTNKHTEKESKRFKSMYANRSILLQNMLEKHMIDRYQQILWFNDDTIIMSERGELDAYGIPVIKPLIS